MRLSTWGSCACLLASTLLIQALGGAAVAQSEGKSQTRQTVSLSTADAPLYGQRPNQGWWSASKRNVPENTNYVVGGCCGGHEMRNFLTFDVSAVEGRVMGAEIHVNAFDVAGDRFERLNLFHVHTDAATLSLTQGTSASIFRDLGTGATYGTFAIPTDSDHEDLRLKLNPIALAHINAEDAYFTVGGALASLSRDTGKEVVFGGSLGSVELILTTTQ